MTRINLVPVQELHDQHLFAEWREIKMVPKSLARSLAARGLAGVLRSIPPQYTLGRGHVSFFYDKGAYLFNRYESLTDELLLRGYQINHGAPMDPDGTYAARPVLCNKYTPTADALALIRARIAVKVAMQPDWYRRTLPLTT